MSLKSYLIKLNKYIGKNSADKIPPNGRISVDNHSEIVNEILLAESKRLLTGRKSENDSSNSDWQRMFVTNQDKTSPMNDYHNSCNPHANDTPSTSLVEYSMPEKNFIQERTSDCKKELNALRNNLRSEYSILKSTIDLGLNKRATNIPANSGIKGILIAHLHEHKSSVTKLAALRSNSSLFASASTDGTVRLFDCNKLNGHQCINK